VEFIPNDPHFAMQFPLWKKWVLTLIVAFATLAVSFVSSAYSGGVKQIVTQFHVGEEVVVLGISLFVLGFALGPLIWAPMSELYGRQIIFAISMGGFTAFNAAGAAAMNIWTVIILRFFAGSFGSSLLTNSGGVIADMFYADQRGLAMSVFASAPFLGPALGPIVGGFVGSSIGWRWLQGIMGLFSGLFFIIGILFLPETYGPTLLRKRAAALNKLSDKVYKTRVEAEKGGVSAKAEFKKSLGRPWILLFREPIVFLLSIYMAIVYGTLYMMFAAFPIVFQETRGWSEGIGGLSFGGVAVGIASGVIYSFFDNKRYRRVMDANNGVAPPEARLPPAMIGGILLPVGLFWFAWTCDPPVHWIVPLIASAPFGFGMVLVFLALQNYLIDAYVIYAASVLAAAAVLRSLFGAAFPLFTTYMYGRLGNHWATTIPAFLALACTPFPFIFHKYGPRIRERCKFAAEAKRALDEMNRED
jgi:multidrug resistance protein